MSENERKIAEESLMDGSFHKANEKIFLVLDDKSGVLQQTLQHNDLDYEALTPEELELLKEDLDYLIEYHYRSQNVLRLGILKKLEGLK